MKYNELLECYKSGQITEKQWVEHMKDEVFRKWVEENGQKLLNITKRSFQE